jgi:hypothetical protein
MLISVITFAGGIGHLVCGIIGLKDGEAVPHCAPVCVAAGVMFLLVSVMSFVTLKSRLGVHPFSHELTYLGKSRRHSRIWITAGHPSSHLHDHHYHLEGSGNQQSGRYS